MKTLKEFLSEALVNNKVKSTAAKEVTEFLIKAIDSPDNPYNDKKMKYCFNSSIKNGSNGMSIHKDDNDGIYVIIDKVVRAMRTVKKYTFDNIDGLSPILDLNYNMLRIIVGLNRNDIMFSFNDENGDKTAKHINCKIKKDKIIVLGEW